MYCGSNKTALTSQKQISEAMLSLLQSKPYVDISVCEICKEAQISRQTFYSLFRSKENVICYQLEQNYCFTIHSDCADSVLTLEELSDAYASYIENQKDFISLLVANDLMDFMRESIFEVLLSCSSFSSMAEESEPVHQQDHSDTEPENKGACRPDLYFTADFIASGLTSIARNYVLHEDQTGPDYLRHIICRLFGGKVFSGE